jgi:hypothetical protein
MPATIWNRIWTPPRAARPPGLTIVLPPFNPFETMSGTFLIVA